MMWFCLKNGHKQIATTTSTMYFYKTNKTLLFIRIYTTKEIERVESEDYYYHYHYRDYAPPREEKASIWPHKKANEGK